MAEFVTCSQDSVVFWDYKSVSSKRSAQPFGGTGYHIQSAAWSANNNKLMVAPKWGDCIAWYEPSTSSEWSTVWHKDRGHFTCGCFLSSSRYLLSGSSDSLLMIWDLKNKTSVRRIEGHSGPVTAVSSSSNEQFVLSGGQDGTLLLHTLTSSHSPQSTITLSHKDAAKDQGVVTRLRFSVIERAVAASASDSGCVCLWSVESQRLLHKFLSSDLGPATDLCFAQSNNKLLVSVGQDCKIRFLDIQQRKEVMSVSTPSPLGSVSILRDGYTVAAGGVDGKLYVYELRAMKSPRHVLEAHQGAITCIAEQNTVKSSRGSMKRGSSKKPAKDSSRLSSLESSDTPPTATPDSSSLPQNHSTQQDPAPLVAPETAPVQQQPLPLAPHVTLSSRTAPPSLPPQTPFLAGARGPVQWSQFTTPAQQPHSDKDSTGIFSPVDSTLSTPHSSEAGASATKIGAPAAPQLTSHQTHSVAGRDSAAETSRKGYPLVSTFVSSTPAMQHPPMGMSGIFSPLDAAPTPASLALTGGVTGRGSTVGGAGVGWGQSGQYEGGWPHTVPLATPSASTPPLSSTVGLPHPPPNGVAGQSDRVNPQLSVPSAASLTTNIPTSSPQTSPSSQHLSGESGSSLPQLVAGRAVSDGDSEVDGPEAGAAATVAPTSASDGVQTTSVVQLAAPIEASSVHLQYLENIIRDSHEELRLATHRDIRALGLDMFRQFLMLQQEVGTAVNALHEKIDRLSEENKRLQEQLHQYAPHY